MRGEDFAPERYRPEKPLKVLIVIPATRSGGEDVFATEGDLKTSGATLLPPLGPAYVAAAARAAGHSVRVMLLPHSRGAVDRARKAARDWTPDVLGINSFIGSFHLCLDIAREVKEAVPGCRVVVGGPHASAISSVHLAHPCVDVVVIGEGEITFCRLLQAWAAGKGPEGIEGLAYRDARGAVAVSAERPLIRSLDTVPMPAVDAHLVDEWFPKDYSLGDRRAAGLVSSRGCPFGCTYCGSKVVWGRSWRGHSGSRVVAEMNRFRREHGITAFVFYDDTLTGDRRRTLEFCEALLREREADYLWCGNTRVDRVDPELLALMRKAGCQLISYGVESGSQRLVDRVQKGVTMEQNRRALEWTRQAGIQVSLTLMIGLPTETREETKQTIRFALEARPDFVSFNIAAPLFGTEMMADALRNGGVGEGRSTSELVSRTDLWVPRGRTRRELERWRRVGVRLSSKGITRRHDAR